MKVSFKTDIGCTRSQNQDAVFVSEQPVGPLDNLFIVADGMGGHNAGDYASKKAIDLIVSAIEQDTEGLQLQIEKSFSRHLWMRKSQVWELQ